MEAHSSPRQDAYDVVVIGAGLGGLSAAAFLARAGKKVLVVERLDGAGGYAHTFKRGDYVFDPAIRTIGQGVAEPRLETLLDALGVGDRCNLLRLDHFYSAVFPDFYTHLPAGTEAFIEAHAEHFPREADGLRRFVELCDKMTRESLSFAPVGLSLRTLDEAAAKFPTLFGYMKATTADVLDECMDDARLKALCTAGWPYLGVPPSKLSFFTWAAMLMSLLEEGPYYSEGSFQRLVDAFVAAIEESGSEILLEAKVDRVLVEGENATGVALDGIGEVKADVVISNADARQTLEELVGEEALPTPFLRKLRRMTPSLSAFLIYAATSMDLRELDPSHESFVFRTWDHDEAYADSLNGGPGGMSLSIPTLVDPSVAPEGEHLVTLMTFAPYELDEPWDQAKGRYEEMLLAELDRILPGIRDQLTFVEAATPIAMHRYSLNQQGAIYGWENTPNQAGIKRLAHHTPVRGLFLSGHWTQPGTGSLGAIYSGMQTAQMVLETWDPDEFLALLH
jgi:prolycopene isomerase